MVRGSSPEHRRARARAGPLLVSLLLILPAAASAYDTGAEREAAYISDSDCLECHDGYDLEKRGARIATCGTCLDHHGLRDRLAIGEVGDMAGTIHVFTSADRVIRPC